MPKGVKLSVELRKLIYYDLIFHEEHIDTVYNRYKAFVSFRQLRRMQSMFQNNEMATIEENHLIIVVS